MAESCCIAVERRAPGDAQYVPGTGGKAGGWPGLSPPVPGTYSITTAPHFSRLVDRLDSPPDPQYSTCEPFMVPGPKPGFGGP